MLSPQRMRDLSYKQFLIPPCEEWVITNLSVSLKCSWVFVLSQDKSGFFKVLARG